MTTATTEIEQGERFEFGKNWGRFLEVLDEERIREAERSLSAMLDVAHLKGRSFLDVGSGSGLFSLSARRLGARVYSFDYDPQSVACTTELKRRYFPNDSGWTVEQGSVLDRQYLESLGLFDVVYSWGVLHHTGAMWQAFENVAPLVADGGRLFIAIYNDQGFTSRIWKHIKQTYNALPRGMRFLVLGPSFMRLWGPRMIFDLLRGRPLDTWRHYYRVRGMSPWRDVIDWVGGYPFEVAKPDEVFNFFKERGFALARLKTCGGKLGCNEFVLVKSDRTLR